MVLPVLPPRMVAFLNALFHESEVEAAWPGGEEELAHLSLWLEVHGAYAISSEEESALENLAFLVREARESVQAGSCAAILGRLAPAVEQAIGLTGQILKERRRMLLSEDECFNDLLLAGAAVLRGGAGFEAVAERLPLAWDRLACLRGQLEVYSEQLVPEFRAEVELGLACFEAALADFAPGPGLEEALTRATRAVLAIDVFQEWEASWRLQTERAFSKYAIPRVGADLEDVVARGWELDRSQWGLGIWRLRKVILPTLQAEWEELRATALLCVPADEVEAPVDGGLIDLGAALAGLTDQERTKEEVLTALEEALLALSDAFRAFERARLRREHLSPTLVLYYDAAQGILGGTLPDATLAQLLETEPLGGEFAAATASLRQYLSGRDLGCVTEALLHVAERAGELARARELEAAERPGLDPDLLRWSRAAAVGGAV